MQNVSQFKAAGRPTHVTKDDLERTDSFLYPICVIPKKSVDAQFVHHYLRGGPSACAIYDPSYASHRDA
jgi:hypothetical protein